MKNITIVILAGGLATRLKPLTEKIPKALIDINGNPFLEHQISLLKNQGFNDIAICTGYLGEQIENYFKNGHKFGVNIKYSYDGDKLLGTGGALKKALGILSDKFLVMYGDSYLNVLYKPIIEYFESQIKNRKTNPPKGLMTVYKNSNQFDKSNVVFNNNEVILYDKKKTTKDMQYIDWGLSIFTKEAFKSFDSIDKFDLEEVLKKLIETEQLVGYEMYQRFYEIGSISGLNELKFLLSK